MTNPQPNQPTSPVVKYQVSPTHKRYQSDGTNLPPLSYFNWLYTLLLIFMIIPYIGRYFFRFNQDNHNLFGLSAQLNNFYETISSEMTRTQVIVLYSLFIMMLVSVFVVLLFTIISLVNVNRGYAKNDIVPFNKIKILNTIIFMAYLFIFFVTIEFLTYSFICGLMISLFLVIGSFAPNFIYHLFKNNKKTLNQPIDPINNENKTETTNDNKANDILDDPNKQKQASLIIFTAILLTLLFLPFYRITYHDYYSGLDSFQSLNCHQLLIEYLSGNTKVNFNILLILPLVIFGLVILLEGFLLICYFCKKNIYYGVFYHLFLIAMIISSILVGAIVLAYTLYEESAIKPLFCYYLATIYMITMILVYWLINSNKNKNQIKQ